MKLMMMMLGAALLSAEPGLYCVVCSDILRMDGMCADAIYVRGLCLYYQDNMEKAFQHFQQVLRFAPDHSKAKDVYRVSNYSLVNIVMLFCLRRLTVSVKALCF